MPRKIEIIIQDNGPKMLTNVYANPCPDRDTASPNENEIYETVFEAIVNALNNLPHSGAAQADTKEEAQALAEGQVEQKRQARNN